MAPATNNAYSTYEERKAMEKFIIDREKNFMYGSPYSKTWFVAVNNDILYNSFTSEKAAALYALNHLYIADIERLAIKDMIESPDPENLLVALTILEQHNIDIL